MSYSLYPLLFQPVFETKNWAGKRMGTFLDRQDDDTVASAGVCWQLLDSRDMQSVVRNGDLEGMPLRKLVERFPARLVGKRHPKDKPFPVCVRLLDVGASQPLFVHATQDMAGETADAVPNAKFWHALDAAKGASVVAGIAPRITAQQVLMQLESAQLSDLLHQFPTRVGDSYLIHPGIVHSIGAGNLMLEVQEQPVPPYKLSDLGTGETVDKSEQDMAVRAMQVEARHNPRISRESGPLHHTRRIRLTPHCPHFAIDDVRLRDHIYLRTKGESFDLLSVVQGSATVLPSGSDTSCAIRRGDICCIPAALGEYKVIADEDPTVLLRMSRPFLG